MLDSRFFWVFFHLWCEQNAQEELYHFAKMLLIPRDILAKGLAVRISSCASGVSFLFEYKECTVRPEEVKGMHVLCYICVSYFVLDRMLRMRKWQ